MSSTRQQATCMFFVVLLTGSVTTLYISLGLVNNAFSQYISRPQSTVILADANVRYVFLDRDHINDVDFATLRLRFRETSPFFLTSPSPPFPIPTVASSSNSLSRRRRHTPYVSLSSNSTTTTSLLSTTTSSPSSNSSSSTTTNSLSPTSTLWQTLLLSPRPARYTSSASINTTASSSLSTTTVSSSSTSTSPSTSSSPSTTSSTPAISFATAPIQSTSEIPDVGTYVSFAGGFADGRGLGNQMFHLAAVVYVAQLTGRQPGMLTFRYKVAIDEVFDLGIQRFANLCPCYTVGESGSLWYDGRLEELANGWRAEEARGKSIFLSGFFQSWKYTLNVERRLRQHFTFLPKIRHFVDKFMASSRPPGWVAFVRVGVHVRRGDVLYADKVQFGYTTPDEKYFAHAMRYFVDRFDRVQFVVACVDILWCRRNFADFESTTLQHRVNVTYVSRRSRSQDFAVIASCEHVIMSTGTFGWWAAWLAHGITIYYADWPKNGSRLAQKFRREDFFPPNWIGMT